ncbi:MAG: aromatic ring-hydroxylating dioxygenase subunit alpha [Pseudomonadota bacterium]|nr:aromatic ring-hydroxylating dioxygenase subunit alpha [Pseudomonadota bacterium]
MLRNIWYFGLASRDLAPGKLVHREICGAPVVFGRTRCGEVFALQDICPHRGVPLSEGRIEGGQVVCCYHGWTFGVDGRCVSIPALVHEDPVDLDKITVPVFPARERQGIVWIWFGDGDGATVPAPEVPGVGETPPQIVHTLEFGVNIDHAVVGLIDPAHTPHVHESWWWRRPTGRKNKEKNFTPTALGFDMTSHLASSNSKIYRLLGGAPEVEIQFALPGIRVEHIRAGKNYYCGMTACTPIDGERTLTTHMMWWSMRWLTLLKPAAMPFVRSFLAQDGAVFAKQAKGLRWDPALRFAGQPDQQAKWYFRLKNEWERSAEAGKAFENPLSKATLRWRT